MQDTEQPSYARRIDVSSPTIFKGLVILIHVIDGAIEEAADVARSSVALNGDLRSEYDEITSITAACILHRIHVRDVKHGKFEPILVYLEGKNNLAAQTMLNWYLRNAYVQASPVQVKLMDDVRKEEEGIRRVLNSSNRTRLRTEVQKRTREYEKQTAAFLFEYGMVNWRYRCKPTDAGLELTFNLGVGRLLIPNQFGIKEPCDVLLSASYRSRDSSLIRAAEDFKFEVRFDANDLSQIRLQRIVASSADGSQVVCVPIVSTEGGN